MKSRTPIVVGARRSHRGRHDRDGWTPEVVVVAWGGALIYRPGETPSLSCDSLLMDVIRPRSMTAIKFVGGSPL